MWLRKHGEHFYALSSFLFPLSLWLVGAFTFTNSSKKLQKLDFAVTQTVLIGLYSLDNMPLLQPFPANITTVKAKFCMFVTSLLLGWYTRWRNTIVNMLKHRQAIIHLSIFLYDIHIIIISLSFALPHKYPYIDPKA